MNAEAKVLKAMPLVTLPLVTLPLVTLPLVTLIGAQSKQMMNRRL